MDKDLLKFPSGSVCCVDCRLDNGKPLGEEAGLTSYTCFGVRIKA